MTRLYRAAALLLLCIFFYQCQKDLSYYGSPDPNIPGVIASDPIKAILQGNIVDESDQPAPGVSITVGTKTVMTNGSGYFRITDASLDKNTSLVIAEKAGYFKGYRVFAATSGTNQVVIKLVKKNPAGTITASSGGAATLSNGAKISLPANSVVIASSGSDYTGDVSVYAAYIDPKANDIAETVPGSFAANDKNGKRVILASYGMLAVELESAAGEKLQIKSGAVASLTTPIPSATLSSAPATIALWYVDEQTGVWKEEGMATKQGNNYVGDVKHFSYWNCDYPYDAVVFSMILRNEKGVPLVNASVEVTPPDVYGFAHGYTDSLGQIKGLVPANQNLILEVFDPCGKAVYSKNLLPLNKNTDIGIITVSDTISLLHFTGTVSDCNGSPVKKGYAIINFNNFIAYAATDDNGKYSAAIITCPGSQSYASVSGVDETSQQQGRPSIATITAPVTDAGNIIACGTSPVQYIDYTVDGTDYKIADYTYDSSIQGHKNATTKAIELYGSAHPWGSNNNLSLIINNVSRIGTYPLSNLNLLNFKNVSLIFPFNVTLTSFASTFNEFYEGSFSGKFTADSLPAVHTVSASFKVKRGY